MKSQMRVQKLDLQRSEAMETSPRWLLAALMTMMLAAIWSPAARATPVNHGIAAGLFNITCEFGLEDNNNATNTLGLSINDFRAGTYNRADLNVQIGSSASDDVAGGILISSVTENGRDNFGTNGYAISTIYDGYRICSFVPNVAGTGGSAVEYNVNVAGAWFPYDRYLGGLARNVNRANGGSNDFFIASPQLVYGTHFLHVAVSNELAAAGGWITNAGKSVLDLRSLGIDSRTDGVLLVNHAKDEANFALSKAEADGTWTLFVHDNATSSAGSYEQDPVAFVYIPRTNTDVVSGRFASDAGGAPTIQMYSGDSPQFTVAPVGAGRWYLQMNDFAATNGVLIISAEGGGTYNLDNIVSYQMTDDGLGWQIQSRDTPANGLQSPNDIVNGENVPGPVASFVFIPAPTAGFTVAPTNNLLTTESGGLASFTVVLDSKPTADVVLNVSSSDLTEGVVDYTSLTFSPDDWNVPQTVTVYGQDDAEADGQVPFTIILSPATSTDAGYDGLDPVDVAVINADDEPGVTLSVTSVVTTEAGGQATCTVVLNTPPTADVTIGLSSSDLTEGTVSPGSLVFTPGDWGTPQTITVTGVNDDVADGGIAYTIVTAAAVSTDIAYNGFNALDVSVVNADNDTAGIVFSPVGGVTVSEPGVSADVSVVLTSEPTGDVTITLTSGDTSEGAVSPASRTFTPANWATIQTFTLTAVDDFINDGTIAYNLSATVLSSDPIYAAMTPSVAASTLDDEAVLALTPGALPYGIGLPGVTIDGQAAIMDSDTADYDTGSLTVTLTANGAVDDRLEIRSTGNAAGEIGVSGGTVSFGGTAIGAFTGGVGTAPLVVTFNNAANPESVQALLRAVTFHNVNSKPSQKPRTVAFALADGNGGVSTASKQIEIGLVHISDFQNGRDTGFGSYTGAADCELNSTAPDNAYPEGSAALGIRIHTPTAGNPFPEVEALLRFDDIVGSAPGQIPPGAIIVSADLMLNVVDKGDGSPLYRMLIPWDADGVSWSSMGEGVSLDDGEAKAVWYSQIGVTNLSGDTGIGTIKVSVLPDVQAWVDGEANYGWVMPCWYMNESASRDLTVFSPCEATNIDARPRLLVRWVPADTASASFRYNVNGYTGAHDTRIRQATPDTEYSTIASVFVDAEVTSGAEDPEQVFVRFEDIFGTGEGQVPPGSTIHAAVLDLGSLVSNATGDGGKIHRMLKPWQDTDTWNSLANGVDADGVEAATAPTATAGDLSLDPNVQGGYLTFLLTSDVQAWANGAPNYGWVFLPWPYGGDGWGFGTAEATQELERPQLRVYYTPGEAADVVVLLAPVVGPTSVQVNFTGTAGKTYSIQRVGTLGGTWETRGTATTGTDGRATFTDSAPLAGAAFYRVIYP